MRIGIVAITLLITTSLQMLSALPAKSQPIDKVEVTLGLNNETLVQAFQKIEAQSPFHFMYREKEVKSIRNLKVKSSKQSVEDFLKAILANTSLTYRQVNNQILIMPVKSNFQNPDALSISGYEKLQKVPIANIVTGRVTNSKGEPLVGVSVTVKGATTGTSTNAKGNYSIDVPASGTLVFSYVGYATREMPVNGRSSVEVVMEENVSALDQVVVVGYGTQKKIDLTGAVATASGDELAGRKAIQLSQALQGAIPGVMVTRSSGSPDKSATIRVRGVTTIGNTNPLIIVDGVQIDNIDDVNPNDIENVSVLKDAASASIYGSQAAAGVILITTKRAKTNQFGLEYSFENGMEIPTETPEFSNVIRYMQMVNETRWNDAGNGPNEFPTYGKDVISDYAQLNRDDPDKYPNTNWNKLIFKKYAPRESHVLRLTGGGDKLRSSASLAYDNVGAIYEKYSYKRLTARINNDFVINKYLKASLDASMRSAKIDQPYTTLDPLRFGRFSPPVYAATWKDGRYAEGKTGDNVYAQLKEGGFKKDWDNHFSARAGIDFTPIRGMKLQAVVAPVFNTAKQKVFRKSIPWYLSDDPSTLGGYIQQPTTLWETRGEGNSILSQLLGHYSNTVGEHTFNLLLGYEDYYTFNESLGASRDNYELDNFPYLNIGPLELRDNSGSASEYARQSFFGRIIYDFKDKYLFQANIRYDASSRFSKDNRWGVFPSASAGWIISREEFMKEVSFLPFLKLRLSYGTLGNERIGNYPYQATMEFNNTLFFQQGNVVSQQSAAQTRYAVRDITWETTESYNVGIDANFLNNKIGFTGDFYRKNTRDMLLALQIPTYMGFDNPDQNAGKMYTTGWEFNLNWNDKIGQVKFKVGFNISDFKSIMGDLGGTEFLGDQIKIQGSEFNEWYGYRSDGLFQSAEDLAGAALISNSTKPGDVRYIDISGSDGKPDGRISPEYDRVLLGGSLPRYIYGGDIILDYRNFDFGITIQGVGKQNVRTEGDWVKPLLQNWMNITTLLDGHYFSKYNSSEQNINAKFPRLTYSNPGNNYNISNFWLFNGRYLRIKNINLGYNIPNHIVKKIKVQNMRIYASISDVFCFNKYPKGYDPESGINNYPITTTVIFGAAIKF